MVARFCHKWNWYASWTASGTAVLVAPAFALARFLQMTAEASWSRSHPAGGSASRPGRKSMTR